MGCVSTTLVQYQQVMSPVLSHATVHVAMSGQVSGVRGRGPDDTGLVIQAPDRGGQEGFFALLVQANAAGQHLLVRVRVILFCVVVGPANLA